MKIFLTKIKWSLIIVLLPLFSFSNAFALCTANAGVDQFISLCPSSLLLPPISLSGSIGGTATVGTWTTTGLGTFTPNANALNAVYNPSPMDAPTNSMTFTLTATGGGCTPVSDDVIISFALVLTGVSAGQDKAVCASVTSVTLAGSLLTATNPIWSTSGTGTFSPNANTTAASYIPSAADKTGSVTLTLKGNGASPCGQLSDAMVIQFYNGATINSQPVPRSICENASTSFGISATGPTGFTYQWQVDPGTGFVNVTPAIEYSNATTSTLTLNAGYAAASHNGYKYRCVLSSCSTSVNSSAVTLTVKSNTLVANNPSDQNVCSGSNAVFTASVTPSIGGVTYQWMENKGSGFLNLTNSASYTGTNTASLTVVGATATQQGYTYQLTVNNGCAPQAQSSARTLNISTLSFSAQPQNKSICEGSSTSFSVAASIAGTATITGYQWQVNQGSGFVDITDNAVYTGAATASLNLTTSTAAMNGYQYQCLVKSTCTPAGTLSSTALLTVNTPASILTSPVASSVCEGANTSFSVTASGTGLGYSWQVDNGSGFTAISDNSVYSTSGTNTLTITGVSAALHNAIYRSVVSATGCSTSAVSNTALLQVNSTVLAILTQPVNTTVWNGGSSSFSIVASGNNLSYQWQAKQATDLDFSDLEEGINYSHVTGALLTLSNITSAFDGTNYRCVIHTTDCGGSSIVTNAATLAIADFLPCLATIGEATGKIEIVINKPSDLSLIDSFNVYRETSVANDFELIGRLYKNASGVFVDTDADPSLKAYQYKLSVTGTNHITSSAGKAQTTIFLEASQGSGLVWQLNWNAYNDNSINAYNIYRGVTVDNLSLIHSTSGNTTSYIDEDVPASTALFYQIEILSDVTCDPGARTASGTSVKSNKVEAPQIITGVSGATNEQRFSVYPNPASDMIYVNNLPAHSLVTIYDMTGRSLKTFDDQTAIFSVKEFPKGMYLIEVSNASSVQRSSLVIE